MDRWQRRAVDSPMVAATALSGDDAEVNLSQTVVFGMFDDLEGQVTVAGKLAYLLGFAAGEGVMLHCTNSFNKRPVDVAERHHA